MEALTFLYSSKFLFLDLYIDELEPIDQRIEKRRKTVERLHVEE